MAEDLGEKTEQPTDRKRNESRKRGQVARSMDLGAAVTLIGAAVLLLAFGLWITRGLRVMVMRTLDGRLPGDPLDAASIAPAVSWMAREAAWLVLPVMLLMFLIAGIGQFLQVGPLLTAYPLKPKLDRLSPIAGFKRLFSRRNLVKTVVNLGKLVVVVAVVWFVVARQVELITSLSLLDVEAGMLVMGRMVLELLAWLLLLLLVIGIVDYLYQRWQHTQDLRMTKHEVKDERRMVDGDPEVKKRRARMAQEVAMQRIQQAVPDADVIVTNPTHFAVAIKYDSATMRAPKVTVKGADYLAARIRHVAAMHGIAIVQRPPLARALYWAVEEGQEIRPEHYEAVAEVLAYVYRMEGRAA
jgi:flagellar biosynthesis protein FlhB